MLEIRLGFDSKSLKLDHDIIDNHFESLSIRLKTLKLPQQIIYRRKENLSESPNHLKYRENILISRFYEHFS